MHPARFPYRKPARGTRFNRSHSLAKFLQIALLLNDKSSAVFGVTPSTGWRAHSQGLIPGVYGTFINSLVYNLSPHGPAISPDGSTSYRYLDVQNSYQGEAALGTKDFTVSGMIRPLDDDNSYPYHLGGGAGTASVPGYAFGVDAFANEVSCEIGDGSVRPIAINVAYSDWGNWHRFTLVVNRSVGAKIYIDDVEVGSQTVDTTGNDFSFSNNIRLGNRQDADRSVYGDVADFFLWVGKALTDAEVKAFTREPYGMFKDPHPFKYVAAGGSAAITGTIIASVTEADIVAGNETIIITLTNDTWIAE